MKRILLILLFAVPSVLLVSGQNHAFKIRHKNPAGTVKPNLTFKPGTNNILKSATPFRYASNKALAFPGPSFSDHPKVIRSGNSPIYIERKVTPSSSTQQNPEVTYNSGGTFRVVLKATNSYGNNTSTKEGYITVTGLTGLNEAKDGLILFYPNPVTDILNIGYDRDFSVRIFDLRGNLILTVSNQRQIDLSTLKPGAYLLLMETQKGHYTHKLMKQ